MGELLDDPWFEDALWRLQGFRCGKGGAGWEFGVLYWGQSGVCADGGGAYVSGGERGLEIVVEESGNKNK